MMGNNEAGCMRMLIGEVYINIKILRPESFCNYRIFKIDSLEMLLSVHIR